MTKEKRVKVIIMNKDVMISIRGLQFEHDLDGEKIEVVQKGRYYRRNGMHYLVYDEPLEGTDKTIKNMIKFNDTEMNVTKKGPINVCMNFKEKVKSVTDYQTPFGSIIVGLNTHTVNITENPQNLSLDISYSLDVNYEFLSDCNIHIEASDIPKKLPLS